MISEFGVLAMTGLTGLLLFLIVARVSSAVENIRIARHTGRDPRVDRDAARRAAGQEGQG